MHLYLIRHAHALDGDDDAARPLSPKGRKQVRKLAGLLQDADAFDAGESGTARCAARTKPPGCWPKTSKAGCDSRKSPASRRTTRSTGSR